VIDIYFHRHQLSQAGDSARTTTTAVQVDETSTNIVTESSESRKKDRQLYSPLSQRSTYARDITNDAAKMLL
jgi:hypothetical protein